MKFYITVLLMFFLCVTLFAHRVVLYGYVENNTVFTESTYPDGKPVSGGRIRVFSDKEKLLLEGKSDEDGMFSFKIPSNPGDKQTGLKIELYVGEGHREVWSLSPEDVSGKTGVSAGGKVGDGDSIADARQIETGMAGKFVLGLACIAIVFAVLYYIKRKLKI